MCPKRMRLTVAHNGDVALVPKLAGYGTVESVFGKMSVDLVGGGRNAFVLAEVDFQHLKYLVQQAHDYNIKYIYLLNASCLSNYETTRDFNNQLFEFIESLVDIGVDGFVVSMPYILDMIKHHFPSKMVSVSTFAAVNSLEKAQIWDDKGADRIIIQQDLNRDFKLLKKIRKAVSCELELFANNMCVNQCPYALFHAAFNTHGSASTDKNGGFGLDYYSYSCARRRMENPVEFIRGRFIRPEDLHLYEDIGIDVFKLADRVKPTSWLVNAVDAYNSRRYDGNLAELIAYPYIKGDNDGVLTNVANWLIRPELVNLNVLQDIAAIAKTKTMVTIDNRKLDGFCEYFTKHDCRNTVCGEECSHCEKYAERAVSLDRALSEKWLTHNKRILDMMVDRSVFAPEPLLKRASIKTIKATSSALSFGKKKISKIKRSTIPSA